MALEERIIRKITYSIAFYLIGTSVSFANCVPPMQTLFACDLENSGGRVEFCHEIVSEETPTSSSVPGDRQSYSFVRGIAPTELYFTPTTSMFRTLDTNSVDRKIYGPRASSFLTIGYQNVDYVYAVLLAVDEEYYNGNYGAEVRVFKNSDDFYKLETNTEVARLFCDAGSVIVDQGEFRP